MKLYIRFGSLAKFQRLYDSNEYLQVILTPTMSNDYFIQSPWMGHNLNEV